MSQAENSVQAPVAKAIDEYLREVAEKRGSDLHFVAGEPPRMRLYGELQPLRTEVLTAARAEEVLLQLMSAAARADFAKRDSTDFAHSVEGLARFRVNVFRHLGGMGAVFRAIPSQAKTLKDAVYAGFTNSLQFVAQKDKAVAAYYAWWFDFQKQVADKRSKGEDVRSLVTPGSKDYVGDPLKLKSFMATPAAAIADTALPTATPNS